MAGIERVGLRRKRDREVHTSVIVSAAREDNQDRLGQFAGGTGNIRKRGDDDWM